MADVDFDKALSRLDKIAETSQIQAIKLELRFLRTFVKYTADRCTEYQDLEDLLKRIQDVGRRAEKLSVLSPVSGENKVSKFDRIAAIVLNKIKLVKPEVRQVYTLMVSNTPIALAVSSLRQECSRDENFFELLKFLRMDAKALVNSKDNLTVSVKNEIKILLRKLRFLETFHKFTADRCAGHRKRNELFTHFQAAADTAAYVSYCCLVDEMDEKLEHALLLDLSNLVSRIGPVTEEVRELYIGALKASKPKPKIRHDIYPVKYSNGVDFVELLLELVMELRQDNTGMIMAMKDQIEVFDIELRSLQFMFESPPKINKPGKQIFLVEPIEGLATEVGCFLFSIYRKEMNQQTVEEIKLAISEWLEKFKLVKARVRNLNLEVPKSLPSDWPRTDELGFFDSLLENLEDLPGLSYWKHHIELIQRDLSLLRTFLSKIPKQHSDRFEDIWRQIIHVAYEAEYAIDSLVHDNPLLHRLLWFSDVINKIKLIKAEVNGIQISDSKVDDIEDLKIANVSIYESSEANTSRMDEEMVGFKDEEEKVIEQLLSGSEHLDFVSIVGMPGRGKTLLAQKVYENPTVKGNFHVRAWSCISQVYGKKLLFINILSQIKEITEDLSKMTEADLAGELHKSLLGQKYLVVLDDMWDIRPWEALRRSFPNNKGSKIVFTSRFHDLASKIQHDSKVHHLRPFSDDESWELLNKKLFGKESCPLELVEVGKQIAKNCKGLPLSVVVVSGILARMKKKHLWKEIGDSLSSYLVNDPNGHCTGVLELSYKNLPDYLKPCFLYFGAFPEDIMIPSWKLIRLWMAEGFIRKSEPNTLEDTAEKYLMDLVGRSLVTVTKRRSTCGIKACSVHDLVRDFCLDKAKKENFLQLIGTSSNHYAMRSSKRTSHRHRRLCVHFKGRSSSWSTSSGPLVRSLLLFAPREVDTLNLSDVPSICRGFKLLRVLDLMCINLEGNPLEIFSLIHLRYLAICGAFDIMLTYFMVRLKELETFLVKIVSDYNGITLPNTISDMVKLRHLQISNWFIFSRQHEVSGVLHNLQTISTPILSYGADMEEKMKRFPNVKKLSCKFKESWDSSVKCNRLPILDFLSRLESLKVSYLGKMRHPCELSFPSNIKKLTLSNFHLPWRKISVIWKLQNLEVLKLLSEAFEGQEWEMEDETFPKLKFMKLEGLNIRRWTASGDSDDHFPNLEQLVVQRCRQLEEIPSCLGASNTLKMIKVQWCSISIVKSIQQIQDEQQEWGNEELKIDIRHCK